MSIDRYTSKRMAELWSDQTKWSECIKLWATIAEVSNNGLSDALYDIYDRSKDGRLKIVEMVEEEEKRTKHDLVALLTVVEKLLVQGEEYSEYKFASHELGFLHKGLTSSDVIDTVLMSTLRESNHVVNSSLSGLLAALNSLRLEYASTPCVGRTHGQVAEVTTFGYKLTKHAAALERCRNRLVFAAQDLKVVKLSGPVGTRINHFENNVSRLFDSETEKGSTQVIGRDRIAAYVCSIAVLAGCLEDLATEIRSLSRSEIGEVSEGFSSGQKGSSSMPHKNNPVKSEKVCGLARVVRSSVIPLLETITLWHERDISNSSVERTVLPQTMAIIEHMILTMTDVITNLNINTTAMANNAFNNLDDVISGRLVTELQTHGVPWSSAHRMVREWSRPDTKQMQEYAYSKITEWISNKRMREVSNLYAQSVEIGEEKVKKTLIVSGV